MAGTTSKERRRNWKDPNRNNAASKRNKNMTTNSRGENNAEYANRLIAGSIGKTNYTKPSNGKKLNVIDMKDYKKPSSYGTSSNQNNTPMYSQLKPEELAGINKQVANNKNPFGTAKDLSNQNFSGKIDTEVGSTTLAEDLGIDTLGPEHYLAALGVSNMFKSALSSVYKATANTAISTIGKPQLDPKIGLDLLGNEFTTVASNTKTIAQTTGLVTTYATKAGYTLPKAVAISTLLVGALGSYPWAGHLNADNLIGTLAIAERDAREAGDTEAAREAGEMLDGVLNPDIWNNIINAIPYANVANSVRNIYKASQLSRTINNKLMDDIEYQKANGLTDSEMYAKSREEETAAQKARVDYFNEQSLITKQKILDLEEEARKEENAAYEESYKRRLKQAEEEREKIRKENEAERIAIAEYWLAYDKAKRKAYEDTSPSKLNFGIL